MDSDSVWLAMALVLVIEGLLPFAAPGAWRRMFSQVLQLGDGQIRFIGLGSIVAGMLWLWWLLP